MKLNKNHLAHQAPVKRPKITVRNAEGSPTTEAQILIQNKIAYTPKISVIMPVYNVAEYLKKSLDSVLHQTLSEIEIICVDDGSTDDSLEILKKYAHKDTRITILTQKNLYAGVARNAGLCVARGTYIHFLDSDDWIDSNTYAELYRLITSKKVNFIKFKSFSYDNCKKKIVNSYYTNMGGVPDSFFEKELSLKKDYSVLIDVSDSPWSGLYDTAFLKKNNIKFDNLLCANDTTFYYRCLTHCKSLYLTSARYVYYRTNNAKSLVGIRALHFDCELQRYFNICRVIQHSLPDFQTKAKRALIQGMFYRFENYMKDSKISFPIKEKIIDEVSAFCKKIDSRYVIEKYSGCYNALKKRNIISKIKTSQDLSLLKIDLSQSLHENNKNKKLIRNFLKLFYFHSRKPSQPEYIRICGIKVWIKPLN